MRTPAFDVVAMGRSSIDLYGHGCANFMPTSPEVEAFVTAQGGWQCEPAA